MISFKEITNLLILLHIRPKVIIVIIPIIFIITCWVSWALLGKKREEFKRWIFYNPWFYISTLIITVTMLFLVGVLNIDEYLIDNHRQRPKNQPSITDKSSYKPEMGKGKIQPKEPKKYLNRLFQSLLLKRHYLIK